MSMQPPGDAGAVPPPPPPWGPAAGPRPGSPLPPPPPPGPSTRPVPAPPPGWGGTGFQVRPSPPRTGVRTAISVLMVAYAAVYAIATFAAFHRKSVWDSPTSTLSELHDADNFVNGAAGVASMLVLAIAILLTVWSARVVANARAQGRRVSGLAAGGWWIPIAWFVVPFVQLRRAVDGRGNTSALALWQALFIVGFGVCRAIELAVRPDFDRFDTAQHVSDDLRNQGFAFLATTVVVAALAVAAIAAMRSIDEVTTTGRSPAPSAA